MEDKLTIDKVRPYLEKGYKLLIQTDPLTSKTSGLLLYMKNVCSVEGMYEVDIDEFMNHFENIKKNLIFHFCSVEYDVEKNKIINSIKERVFVAPYNENIFERIVGNLEVETDDLFTGFIDQEEKVRDFFEEKKINMLKLKKKTFSMR